MGVVQKELRLHIDFLKGKGGKKSTCTPRFKFNLKSTLPLGME